MQRLIEVARLYGEGCLTAREFLGITADCIAREWQSMPDSGQTEFANFLATAIETYAKSLEM